MKKLMLLSLGVVGALASIDGDAVAANMAGAAGAARLPTDRSCFQFEFGRVFNTNQVSGVTCDNAPLYTIVTPTISGSRNFAATGCAASADTKCAVVITGVDGWHKNGSVAKRLTTCPINPPASVALATLSPAATDSVLFECSIAPGTLTGTQNWVGTVSY